MGRAPARSGFAKWERASAPIAQERVRRGAEEERRDVGRRTESASLPVTCHFSNLIFTEILAASGLEISASIELALIELGT
jgi:hypothetical protein